MERIIDLKEYVTNYLSERNLQTSEKVLDLIVEEFATVLDSIEAEEGIIVEPTNARYNELLEIAMVETYKNIDNIDFSIQTGDIYEDDYSEESTAEMQIRR